MMLTTDLKLITSPVIIVINGIEKEYCNGAAAAGAVRPDSRLTVQSIYMKKDHIVVELIPWADGAPFNFVGDEAVE